jgi:hypothetical protein
LELLVVSASDDSNGTVKKDPRARAGATRTSIGRRGPHLPVVTTKPDSKGGFSITFAHLGRRYYQMTLYAPSVVSQRKWMEHISKQQDLMRERSTVFETEVLSEGFFVGGNKVNCAAPFSESFLSFVQSQHR